MSIVSITPKERTFPTLAAGDYHPHAADPNFQGAATITAFENVATKMPNFDKDGEKAGSYTYLEFKVVRADATLPIVNIRHWYAIGHENPDWDEEWKLVRDLETIGVQKNANGDLEFEENDLVGLEMGVTMAAPSEKGFNKFRQVISL